MTKLAIALFFFMVAISQGHAVIDGEADTPHHAVMVLNSRGGVCSGIVLSAETVLTAAHCIKGASELRVHFKNGSGASALIPVQSAIPHPSYVADAVSSRKKSVDLALLKVSSPLPGQFVPAPLSGAIPRMGETISVAGYGQSREDNHTSMGTYRSADLPVVEPYGPGKLLLWMSAGGNAGACHGDSGGPIFSSGRIVAVISWTRGKNGKDCGEFTQGVLLGPQRVWIDATLHGWGQTALWR